MKLEEFTFDSQRVEIASAVAAGLGLSGLACLISVVDHDSVFDFRRCIGFMVFAVGSYLTVALLLCRWWKGQLKHAIPIWILIALLGTMFLVGVISIDRGIVFWRSSQRTVLGEFINGQWEDIKFLFVLGCGITLPITATVHYAPNIIRAFVRWRKGPEPPRSILGGEGM